MQICNYCRYGEADPWCNTPGYWSPRCVDCWAKHVATLMEKKRIAHERAVFLARVDSLFNAYPVESEMPEAVRKYIVYGASVSALRAPAPEWA
jgi:hypothetical protein